jgi:hypothetical protein
MEASFPVDATSPESHDLWRPLIDRLRRPGGTRATRRAAHSDDDKGG